jgi:sugar phosphate isomerase/epimerase
MVELSINRRHFLGGAIAAGVVATTSRCFAATPSTAAPRNQFCVFIKYLQPLSYDELADSVAELGFDGIEATVRKDGYIEPAQAADELPKLAEVLRQRGLAITMLTTDLLRADDPHARPVLKTAADLGISMYRLGFYQYDLAQPVMPQLAAIGPQIAGIAALNRELSVQGLYQNHSGAEMVGATVWDIYSLIKDLPPQQLDLAFDVRHATIEAGLAWPAVYNAMRPRIAAVYVKDFNWKGRRVEHVPLGQGQVDRRFFGMLRRDNFGGPISLHVEYARNAGPRGNLAALRRDFATLKSWLET